MGKGKRTREKRRREWFPKPDYRGSSDQDLDDVTHAVERLIGDKRSNETLVDLLTLIEGFLIELQVRRLLESEQSIPTKIHEAVDLREGEAAGMIERVFDENGLSWRLTEAGQAYAAEREQEKSQQSE